MSTDKAAKEEFGVAFAADDQHPFIPDDCISAVWLGQVNDRTGKRLYRGTLDVSKLPQRDGKIHVILFPFRAGDQYGISIQLSRKHHPGQP